MVTHTQSTQLHNPALTTNNNQSSTQANRNQNRKYLSSQQVYSIIKNNASTIYKKGGWRCQQQVRLQLQQEQ